jgi:hypothetical protein
VGAYPAQRATSKFSRVLPGAGLVPDLVLIAEMVKAASWCILVVLGHSGDSRIMERLR